MKPLLDAIFKFLVAQVRQAGIDFFLSCISFLHTLYKVPNSVQLKFWPEIYYFLYLTAILDGNLIPTAIIRRPLFMHLYHNMINKQQLWLISDQKTLETELYMHCTGMCLQMAALLDVILIYASGKGVTRWHHLGS